MSGNNNNGSQTAASSNGPSDKARTDAGDLSKNKTQSVPSQPPKSSQAADRDSDDSPTDAGESSSPDSSRAAIAGSMSDSQSQAGARNDSNEGNDMKDSLPHSSDLNGAPIVASAASSHSNGSGGYNRNWNGSGGYNRNRSHGMGRGGWGGSGGNRNNGPHNNRPPHMAPISPGYSGPGGRRFAPAPNAPFAAAYGYVPPPHMVPVSGADAVASGLLPTPAVAAPFPPYGMPCGCNACVMQYYYISVAAAAAAHSMYAPPAAMYPNMTIGPQAHDSYNSFQQQQPIQPQMDAGSGGPVMSPRPKGAQQAATVVYLQQQQQKPQKSTDSKAGLTPIPMPAGGVSKSQPIRGPDQGQQQQQPAALLHVSPSHWQPLHLAPSELDQQQSQQQQQQQSLAGAATGVRYTYFPNIVNPQMMSASMHDMGSAPLFHDIVSGQASQQAYMGSYTPRLYQ